MRERVHLLDKTRGDERPPRRPFAFSLCFDYCNELQMSLVIPLRRNPRGAARRATRRRRFATCPGLLFENPKVQIARPVALEGTLTNLGQLPPGIDGLRLDPSVPLRDDQALRFFLFHSTRAD